MTTSPRLDTMKEVNGLTIEQIELRAKPINDNTTDAEWRFRSFDGFLGADEGFVDLIRKDLLTCESLGVSPSQLAQELKNILFTTEQTRDRKNFGVMKPIEIEYSSALFPNRQKLVVSHQLYNGYQYSLFFNDSQKDSTWNTQWNEEYVILNEKLGLDIKVAGNNTQGVIQYIENLGFFEGGGVYNGYRVDPTLLFTILSGKCTPSSIQICKEKQHVLLQEPLRELIMCQERVKSCKEEMKLENNNVTKLTEELYWTQSRIGFIQERIERQKEDSQNFLNKLESFS